MPESWFEKMERYLHRSMTTDERAEFESELLVNEKLAFDFEIYRMIEEEMSDFEKDRDGEEALKDSLNEISSSFINRTEENEKSPQIEKDLPQLRAAQPLSGNNYHKQGKLIALQKFAIAAAIMGVIAIGVTWYFINDKENSVAVNKKPGSSKDKKPDSINLQENQPKEDLANAKDKIKHDEELNNTRQETLSTDTKAETLYAMNFKRDKTPANKDEFLADAYSYYDNGEYKNAIKAFDNADLTIVSRGNENDTIFRKFYAHYYKAQSYMVMDRPDKAIVELTDAVNQSPDKSLEIKTQWYLALAYLKKGAPGKSLKLLKQIASNEEEAQYKLRAKKLISELEKK